jgi:hypothetical protein
LGGNMLVRVAIAAVAIAFMLAGSDAAPAEAPAGRRSLSGSACR